MFETVWNLRLIINNRETFRFSIKRAPVPAPTHVSTPAPAPAPTAVNQPQHPSLMGQMAATATGVAVGSAVGHGLGHVVTGLMSQGGSNECTAPPPAAISSASDPPAICAREMKQFLDCAYKHNDLSLCEGFNESLRQCKTANSQ